MTIISQKQKIEEAVNLIKNGNHVVAFTGAGISTDSGIPDVDGIINILDNDPDFIGDPFTFSSSRYAINHTDEFYKLYRQTFFQENAKPNYTHKFLADLEADGILDGIATMNIDWLHKMAGSKNVFEYWGNIRKNRCTGCHKLYDWYILKKEEIPRCDECGSIIIPEFIMKNLATYPDQVKQGTDLINQADVLLILGTKRGPSSFPRHIKKIIVNNETINDTSKDDIYIKGDSDRVFKEMMSQFDYL
ncbi:SIR2 family NAD-dependent protein deacylase [Fructilactobacillus sp. Tb1]|uniref:SIR2 family NAD-dependent protein deacylase n=1 Tax=Fructilactobacillus sp. Tb1 TaxID=3422304 RepID=UPI003D28AA53